MSSVRQSPTVSMRGTDGGSGVDRSPYISIGSVTCESVEMWITSR